MVKSMESIRYILDLFYTRKFLVCLFLSHVPHKHASIGPVPGRCCILNRPDAGKTFWPDIGPASFAQRRDIGPMPALRYMP